MKFLALFVAIVCFVAAYGQAGDPQVYCGRRLAEMMAVLCYTKYDKRSGYNSLQIGYEPEYGWPWLAAARALADRGHRGHGGLADRSLSDRGLSERGLVIGDLGARGKRGIIEDCCEQSCSIQTLMSYC